MRWEEGNFVPFYDYDCKRCGEFSLMRTVSDRNTPAECPACGGSAQRLVSAPFLNVMPAGRRDAFARNEKSRHEPGVTNRHRCGAGCGCGLPGAGTRASTRTVDVGKLGKLQTPRKRKRPWMLGH